MRIRITKENDRIQDVLPIVEAEHGLCRLCCTRFHCSARQYSVTEAEEAATAQEPPLLFTLALFNTFWRNFCR
jgi:hypothetical protein